MPKFLRIFSLFFLFSEPPLVNLVPEKPPLTLIISLN